jgi:ATP-dependent DNA helicase DinG
VDRTVEAVRGSGGGALVLCSSRTACDRITVGLRRAKLPWTILSQGDAGRAELRGRFKSDHDSVLVGTRSFYEGLDVVGQACRLVIIDRVPFDPPGDPVEDAVGKLSSQRSGGASPFLIRSLPRASSLLAQAAGRLVRSATDRGVLVLLDRRVAQPGSIGAACRRALPPFPMSQDIGDVARHLAGQPIHSAAPMPAPIVNGRVVDGSQDAIPLRRRSA